MSSHTKNLLTLFILVIVGFFVVKWVFGMVLSLVWHLVPLVLIAGALYVAYQAFGRKALSGGRRTLP